MQNHENKAVVRQASPQTSPYRPAKHRLGTYPIIITDELIVYAVELGMILHATHKQYLIVKEQEATVIAAEAEQADGHA
ncbi:hypothetical protein PR202_gb16005 [Eleusine coracana subsp. coracana]|uniref:Uncharacterized protein n=1 Tax=Eleusine coracana subsp. coracana TaxID=191504 RepID=A0AAV5EZV5_ELECO|nr:hypothetical protein PR202_gb16005 [Eleusine coracana subsp. coracana]